MGNLGAGDSGGRMFGVGDDVRRSLGGIAGGAYVRQ